MPKPSKSTSFSSSILSLSLSVPAMSVLLRTYPLIPLRPKHPLTLFFPATLRPFFLLPKAFSQSRSLFSASASACSISSFNNPSPYPHESLIQPPKPPLSHKETLDWVKPTGFCGELSLDDVGRRFRLCGWVALHRVHGGLTFFNLRDDSGVVQVTTLPDDFPDAHSTINDLRLEYVISVEGRVRQRPSKSINKKMKTGYIEVAAEHVQVLNTVKSKLPFLITSADDAEDSAKEEIRLRYRCLDLRRQQMKSNIILRHNVVKLIRRYLEDVHGFVEVD